jgi:hypothetical protein
MREDDGVAISFQPVDFGKQVKARQVFADGGVHFLTPELLQLHTL